MTETKNYYKTPINCTDHTRYGGEITELDFDGHPTLSDIAKDEQIKSVRYMGQYGYVVTFRNTDPLFVIDFSDPTKPEIKGEVKLPGFSEYLHPVGNGMLVGIGYDGDEENANFRSVKISLFDVSDPTKPLEIDNHVIKNASTDVNYDPKAFLYYPEENTIGIPLQYDLVDGNIGYLPQQSDDKKDFPA